MKILSLILAIYFFGLSVKTCGDDANTFSDNCQTSVCEHTHIETSHNDSQEADSCSPFCTCQCCGGFALLYEFTTGFKSTATLLEKPGYSEKSISEISHSIWQPPKVS